MHDNSASIGPLTCFDMLRVRTGLAKQAGPLQVRARATAVWATPNCGKRFAQAYAAPIMQRVYPEVELNFDLLAAHRGRRKSGRSLMGANG
jgi:hypothetical protein